VRAGVRNLSWNRNAKEFAIYRPMVFPNNVNTTAAAAISQLCRLNRALTRAAGERLIDLD
jgi:hypothetical protein